MVFNLILVAGFNPVENCLKWNSIISPTTLAFLNKLYPKTSDPSKMVTWKTRSRYTGSNISTPSIGGSLESLRVETSSRNSSHPKALPNLVVVKVLPNNDFRQSLAKLRFAISRCIQIKWLVRTTRTLLPICSSFIGEKCQPFLILLITKHNPITMQYPHAPDFKWEYWNYTMVPKDFELGKKNWQLRWLHVCCYCLRMFHTCCFREAV